jgi:hypothetical protein
VKTLISAGVDIKTAPNRMLRPAIRGRRAENLMPLSAEVNIIIVHNRTLMAAIRGGHMEILKTLISAEVDIKYLLLKQMIAAGDLLENDKRHLETQ